MSQTLRSLLPPLLPCSRWRQDAAPAVLLVLAAGCRLYENLLIIAGSHTVGDIVLDVPNLAIITAAPCGIVGAGGRMPPPAVLLVLAAGCRLYENLLTSQARIL